MSLKKLLEKATLTRRNLLKGMGAVVATAAVSGCSNDSSDFNPVQPGQSDLKLEQADRYAFNTGPFNCGSRCVHKFHVKNGRIMAMTSAGDTQKTVENAEDEYGSTEIGKPMQFRSCVRGYSYIQRVYQPDRLKYPLFQTGEKGNIATFKRISWDEAFEKIGKAMADAFGEAATLGYVPVVDRMSFVAKAAKAKGLTYLKGCSNASNGNYEAAKMDSVGTSMLRNSKSDNMNSKFTIVWGADPTRHSNHENGSYWLYTKSKENSVPFITISPVCTDQAVTFSSSVHVDLPASGAPLSADKTVTIPGWVPIRPGTDGALALAMCYVLYRRGIYDKTYLTKGAGRKCFGFYQGDSVTSIAPETTRSGFRFEYPADGANKFKGKTLTVAAGKSFEEILMNLEKSIANGGWSGTADGAMAGTVTEDVGYNMSTNDAYSKVLAYAAKLTGVKADVIEALAYHFAKTDPSKIDGGCGPQRQYNGAEWCWLIIVFSVMAGHVEKVGGGLPIGMGSFSDDYVFGSKTKDVAGTGFIYNLPRDKDGNFTDSYIDIMDQNLAEIVLTGRDGRTVARFKADNALTVDTAKTPDIANIEGVKVSLYTMSGSNRLITHPNVNKTIEAYKNIKTVIICDQVMTPSAAYGNIILPAAMHLEDVGGIAGEGEINIYKQNVLPKPMYQSKRQGEINALYLRACAKALGLTEDDYSKPYVTPADLDNNESSKKTVEAYTSSKLYDSAVGMNAKVGTRPDGDLWKEFTEKGCLQIVTPMDKPIRGLVDHLKPGVDLETSTGYINFYSPFWADGRKNALATIADPKTRYTVGDYSAGWRTVVADYIPNREGYEKFFKDCDITKDFIGYVSSRSGRTYKLQFITNKARNRAHTCQDNVAIIKDQFEQKVYMNPKDAEERFIKDGDMVYVYNDRGCTKIRASVTHYIIPGVISVEHGAWYRAATDPKETVKVYIGSLYDTTVTEKTVPVDLGGCENLITDDRFVYDPLYVNQTAGVHGGPVEVSLTKPE